MKSRILVTNAKKPKWQKINTYNHPVSKASREVANLTERKKSTYPSIWFQRICLSVCLSIRVFHFWQEIITLTSPIRRGAGNLPRKFHLYLILSYQIAWKSKQISHQDKLGFNNLKYRTLRPNSILKS